MSTEFNERERERKGKNSWYWHLQENSMLIFRLPLNKCIDLFSSQDEQISQELDFSFYLLRLDIEQTDKFVKRTLMRAA